MVYCLSDPWKKQNPKLVTGIVENQIDLQSKMYPKLGLWRNPHHYKCKWE